MHACGHDGHMAMLLGLTDFITKHIEDLIYNVVLIYQPSEEISGGAQSVIQSGLLDKYEVQAIFGFHLWPGLAKGEVFSRPGPLMAQSSETDIIIKGQSAHIASSEKGIDSLEAAVRFLKNVYDFDRQLPAEWNHLMKFGQIQGFSWRSYCIRKYPFLQFRYAKLFEEGIRPFSRTVSLYSYYFFSL